MLRLLALVISVAVAVDLARHTVASVGTLDRWFVVAVLGTTGTVGCFVLLAVGTLVWFLWGVLAALGRLWNEPATPSKGVADKGDPVTNA